MKPPIEIPGGMGCVWSEQRQTWILTLVAGQGRKFGAVLLPSHTADDWQKMVAAIRSAADINGGK